jgi:hypothetical protein
MNYDTVFHVDNETISLNIAVNNIVNFHKALAGTAADLVLVVNGPGVLHLVRENAEVAEKIRMIHGLGVRVRVCNNALVHFNLSEDRLCPECEVVPAGVVALVECQKKGFAYIKP